MSKMKNHLTAQQAARADRYTFTGIGIGLLSFAVFLSAFFVGSEFSIFPATASLLLVCASIVCFLLGSIHSDGPGVIHTAPARRPHAVPLSGPVNRPRVDIGPAPGTGCRAALINSAPDTCWRAALTDSARVQSGPTSADIETVAAYYRRNGQRLIRRIHGRGPDSFRVLTLGTGEERTIEPRTVSLLAELENTFAQ